MSTGGSPRDLAMEKGRWSLPRWTGRSPSPMKDLTKVEEGEVVEVREVVFGSVKEYCGSLGIRPGMRLRVLERGADGTIGAEDMEGNPIRLTWDFALFIWVSGVLRQSA